jgi:ABC-type lipoprotein release transport system permease subunit
VARLAQVAFIGVNVLNPLTYVAVALVECVIVLLACIGPALRASRVDPLVALRSL